MSLTDRQRAFVEYYLQSGSLRRDIEESDDEEVRYRRTSYFNATQAARMAGYANPRQSGSELLSKPDIKAKIAERMKELEAQTAEMIAKLRDRAISDMGDFAEVLEEQTVPRMLKRARALGISHLIKKVKMTPEGGLELELKDDHQATKLLGERLKLWEHENGKFDLTALPPVLLNLSQASPDEIHKVLEDMRRTRRGEDD